MIEQGHNRNARRENIRDIRSHRVSTTRDTFVHAEGRHARSRIFTEGASFVHAEGTYARSHFTEWMHGFIKDQDERSIIDS